MSRFPHLTANGNESSFPDISTVRTYQYDNKFDYSKFDTVQMNITLCKVPWDMGEAHIGNRTISGIGNVVHFGSKEKRDKWFDDIPDSKCFRFATKLKQLHRDNFIDVPVPFDVASRYNYIAVHQEPMANAENFVLYEDEDGLRDWFWFVREVEFLSPNTTRLHLLNDAWQTFIYDIDIPYMMLQRGHAPMVGNKADRFLSMPIENCSYLLEREENEPAAPRITTKTQPYVFNSGEMYAVVVTTANPRSNWGSKSDGTWKTPSTQFFKNVPTYHSFAVPAGNFATFLQNVPEQFIQTVQCVCFMSEFMITLGVSFSFGGQTCYEISSAYRKAEIHDLTKDDFAFDERYADIAKLYTYPYSVIVLSDNDGNETVVRIEDTNGKIEIEHCTSLVYPWLKINGHVSSVGKAARKTISFKNITTNGIPISGNWHSYLMSFDIPMFAVTQSAETVNDYSTHFDRAQQDTAAANAQANQNASASNVVSNAGVTTAGNSAKTATANAGASTDAGYTNDYTQGNTSASNLLSGMGQASTIDAQEKQAAIAAATGMATGVVGALTSGSPVGAAASLGSAAIGAAGTMASMNVAVGLTAAEGALARAANNASNTISQSTTSSKVANQNSTQSSITETENSVISSHAANDSATMIANASRDRATVTSAISNQQKQAALGEPSSFGDLANGDYVTTRPLALFSNVVTQDSYTIRKCGDDFLRYGYTVNCEWDFSGNWCPMKHFTYWKLNDFWVNELQVPDMYVDRIRFFLFGGVTVWKVPEEIGNVDLYDNYS